MTGPKFIFVAAYFTAVGYGLAKTGAIGKTAARLRLLRDDMIRRDILVANDMAMAIEQVRAAAKADVSRETSPGASS